MRYIKIIFFSFFVFASFSFASTRANVKVIESSEKIRFFSQNFVRNYLFYYYNSDKKEIKAYMDTVLNKLSEELRTIAMTTKDSDTKDILEFLAYSKDQMKILLDKAPNENRAFLMLDYSETLLEGIDSIIQTHLYDFNNEEKMLVATHEIEYLLERITKYYMAKHLNLQKEINTEQIQLAIAKLKTKLDILQSYKYPYEMNNNKRNFFHYWEINKYFFQDSSSFFIPNLLFNSIETLEKELKKLTIYHSKNQ